jgi:hypothetical protein
LQSNVNAPDVAQFANGRWKQMLEDGSADDFVAQVRKKKKKKKKKKILLFLNFLFSKRL